MSATTTTAPWRPGDLGHGRAASSSCRRRGFALQWEPILENQARTGARGLTRGLMGTTRERLYVTTLALIVALAAAPRDARADIAKFDIDAKLYTKWLYWNNDSQGLLNYGNPFWPDEGLLGGQAGDNGVGSEFEITFRGRVSRYVETGVRVKSRFGALWHDWWENGNMRYPEHNTSGESLGMNHAEYLKLRGYYVRIAPPIPTVEWVTVGSSDLGMFNEWTIGRVRYIDRDNAKGFFLLGSMFDDMFRYHLAVIALPRLYVGPGWSTGVGDDALDNPFYTQDYAYGARFDIEPLDWMQLSLVGSITHDLEFDRADPDAAGALYPQCQDALGQPVPGCEKDHAVDWNTRYLTSNITFEAVMEPLDWLYVHLLGGLSIARLNSDYVTNGVIENNGVFPVIYDDTMSYAARARFFFFDPFDIGLSFKFEYFNIGEDWNAIFGARREGDVLLTDGFIEGGQLPTLNLANEFVDFDEDWVESCIGWHGATGILELVTGALKLEAEGTFITYNTNGQFRATQDNEWTISGRGTAIYPTFLHTEGYTDTDLYDYQNKPDDERGRDPRSVYHLNQDRWSVISVLKGRYTIDIGRGLDIFLKAKLIHDEDGRSTLTGADDYAGDMLTFRLALAYPLTDEFRVQIGAQIDQWWEAGRKGTLSYEFDDGGRILGESIGTAGYEDDKTEKYKAFVGVSYAFGGVQLKWLLEYVHKTLDFGKPGQETLLWDVWRSKAALEVAW